MSSVIFFVVRLCLNRQAILLLSGLGVPDETFFRLQDRMLINMADILLDENIAAKAIAKVCAHTNNILHICTVLYRVGQLKCADFACMRIKQSIFEIYLYLIS